MLEIARQSVPDGYGNSYFWVKPDRIVPRHLVKGVGGRLDFTGAEVRPFDEDGARAVARWFKAQGITTLGVCFLHAYANPEHEERMRAVLAEEHPDAVVSLSSEVLREYREYERAMTTLVDAAVKPRLSAYVTNIKGRLAAYAGERRVPFYVMKSNGGVLSADEVVHQPITTVLSGPAAGALGAALIAAGGRLRPGAHQRRRRHVDRRQRRHRRRADADHRGLGRRVPVEDPDDRRRHRRRRAAARSRGSRPRAPSRSARSRPAPIPARSATARAATEVTITDAHVVLGRIPPHLLGGEIPLDVDAARAGVEALAGKLGAEPRGLRHRHPGDLRVEPGQRAAPGHRQARPRRPRLHADHVRRLRLAAAVPADGHPRHPDRARPAEPRQRLGVRAADRRRQERLRADPRVAGRAPRRGRRDGGVRRPRRRRRPRR